MKIHAEYICPHCDKEDKIVMYAAEFDTVECYHCEKPVDLKISNINKYGSDVVSLLPERVCNFCEEKFLSQEAYEDEEECPHCGDISEHFNPNRYK